MFLVQFVIAVCTSVCFFNFIILSGAIRTNEETAKPKKEKDEELEEIQQKTPLIDIIFTDGTTRTCTGAIIHDFVVITAGHCFIPIPQKRYRGVTAELTGSFVVIGTRKKFDSGYEQYLPIERVITHPNMKGWSCDLALVHTFASMTSDRIGAIMQLAGEKTSTSIEPNVTILSWGRVIDDPATPSGSKQGDDYATDSKCCSGDQICDSEERNKCDDRNHDHGHKMTHAPSREAMGSQEERPHGLEERPATILYRGKEGNRYGSRFVLRKGGNMDLTTVTGNKYMSSNENLKTDQKQATQVRADFEEEENLQPMQMRRFMYKRRGRNRGQYSTTSTTRSNWRRLFGSKGANKLTLETFGFLNAATCKKILFRAQPDMSIHGNEIVCYASDDHYVTEEDSGAPVVRLGQLIAITVGGITSEGDHVAVGMKLSYFCPWINENLPAGDSSLNCWAQQGSNAPYNESSIVDETYKRIRIH